MNELCTLQDDVPSFPDEMVGWSLYHLLFSYESDLTCSVQNIGYVWEETLLVCNLVHLSTSL